VNTIKELDTPAAVDVTSFAFTRSAWVDAAPRPRLRANQRRLHDRPVKPTAAGVAYDDGAGPWAGAWLSGAIRRKDREWTTRSQEERAEPGTVFSFVVGGTEHGIVRWSWDFRRRGRGSLVQQSWQLLRFDRLITCWPVSS
jgi:hypothetical protein